MIQIRSEVQTPAVDEYTGRPKPDQPRLLSSSDGRLTEVLLSITGMAQTEPEVVTFFQRFINKLLEKDVKVTILTQLKDQDGAPLKDEWPDEVERISVPWPICFTMWARDPFVVLKDEGDNDQTWLAEPLSFERMGDALVADWYANKTKTPSTQTALSFEGGNILCGDDFVLIGANSINESLSLVGKSIYTPRPPETPIDRVRNMYVRSLDTTRRWFDIGTHLPVPVMQRRQVERYGETWTEVEHALSKPGNCQPLFHLDMFLTLAGRENPKSDYRILVGDPRWAARLMHEPLPAGALADHFDDVAASLRGMGFEVIRNPLAYLSLDDQKSRTRTWYYASSNNMLVERFDHAGKAGRAWLPTYGSLADLAKLKAVDEVNKAIWEKQLNFEVEEITGCLPFVQNNGSIHCLVKELERTSHPIPAGHKGWQAYRQDPRAPIHTF